MISPSLTMLLSALALPPTVKVAVYEIEALEPAKVTARVATDALVVELRKREGVNVIGMDEVRKMLDLEAQKQLAGCSDESCVAEIAEALGADFAVFGGIAAFGDEIVFNLKLIDQKQAKAIAHVAHRLTRGSGDEVLAAIGPAVAQMFPDRALRPGQTAGVSPEVALRLNPPPLDPLVFWGIASASAVASVVALASFGVNTATHAASIGETNASAGATGATVSGEKFASDVSLVRTSFVVGASSAGTSIVLAGVAAVATLYTDWDGYREQNEKLRAGVHAAPTSSSSAPGE